jgi:2,5-diamino-6-(ribosylamino)-4(3H)-pyrimidinone 5'-phosphate reductase
MRRPKVIINCAMTADGKIAMPDGGRLQISSEKDMERVQRMRSRADAILVGIGTILMDDPSLLVKKRFVKRPRQPLRVVLDSKGRIPAKAKVMDGQARTLIAVTQGRAGQVRKKARHGTTEAMAFGRGKVDIKAMLSHLWAQGVRVLMVEGGGEVIWSFVEAGLFDDITIFVGDMMVGGKGPTPASGIGIRRGDRALPLRLISVRRMDGGVLLHYRPAGTRERRSKVRPRSP